MENLRKTGPGLLALSSFSPVAVHRANGFRERKDAVFPIVHTPYDFYERI